MQKLISDIQKRSFGCHRGICINYEEIGQQSLVLHRRAKGVRQVYSSLEIFVKQMRAGGVIATQSQWA